MNELLTLLMWVPAAFIIGYVAGANIRKFFRG